MDTSAAQRLKFQSFASLSASCFDSFRAAEELAQQIKAEGIVIGVQIVSDGRSQLPFGGFVEQRRA